MPIEAGALQGSVLVKVLHLFYTCDILETEHYTTATFADDTAMTAVWDKVIPRVYIIVVHQKPFNIIITNLLNIYYGNLPNQMVLAYMLSCRHHYGCHGP